MLNLPDRQRRFQQLCAHWEAVETGDTTKMVGRRVKQQPHQATQEDTQHEAGSKFRRKLSNGLALFSLPQRKVAPGRRLSSNASLAVSTSSDHDSSTAILSHDALLSPRINPASLNDSGDGLPSQDKTRVDEDTQTPKQLPRSRTFSYIPRPVKTDADGEAASEPTAAAEPTIDTITTDTKPLTPCRIPTPSPPQSKRQVSSPRQYLRQHSSSQVKIAVNRMSLVSTKNGSPSKAAVRSRTTPNLLKTTNASQSASYMAPRRPGIKRPFAHSSPQKPLFTENVPTSNRVAQRHSQIQEKAVKRESLAIPSASSNSRSREPGTPLAQNKRTSFAAPSVSAKRLSSHIAQTPVTVKRAFSRGCEGLPNPESLCPSDEACLTEPRPRSSQSSLTPTLATVNLTDIPLAPPPRIRDTEHDIQRRTLRTRNGLGGVWRPSEVFAAANHQVRRLPRSSTIHSFGRREAPPPVPPIPNQYKAPSSSNLAALQRSKTSSLFNLHHRFPMGSGKSGSFSKSLLSEIASAQQSTEAASLRSATTLATVAEPEVVKITNDKQPSDGLQGKEDSIFRFDSGSDSDQPVKPLSSPSNLTALPPIKARLYSRLTRRPDSISHSTRPTGDLQSQRQWSISKCHYPDGANKTVCVQVRDYMPPLYWAGRFQSRFDQWRTEAMVAVLNPEVTPEDDGLLGQCDLDNEKKATLLIFMQLRDFCASPQAAESLHEFEYRYRRDHKMLDTKHDFPPSLRKPEELTPKGPIGRAVHKLTPRKASFANLFKGKGWSRTDDTKQVNMPGHVRELQEIADRSDVLDNADSDDVDSISQLQAR